MLILQSIFGLSAFVGLAYVLSENRKCIPWKTVFIGIILQIALAALFIKLPLIQFIFEKLNQVVLILSKSTTAGTSFLFGYLGGGDFPFQVLDHSKTFILAFNALPIILVISALSSLLFYWRILPWIVEKIAILLTRSLGIGGALGLGASANIFVGMIEAPLLIKPYLSNLSRSEMFALMTTGMATIAGTMMVLYASILSNIRDDAMGHILSASVISVPAALVISLILIPNSKENTSGNVRIHSHATSSMDAITRGTLEGVKLLLNIVAMLLVFVAMVALINHVLALLPALNDEPINLQRILGWVFSPFMWLLGIPSQEVFTAGSIMGIKIVLNEFLAYIQLVSLPKSILSERSNLIMIYALCGFANFGSLGIMLGGIGTMVPERRSEIAKLGMKSILAGTLATMMTGALVGIFI